VQGWRQVIVKATPSAELLTLLFGVTAAASINLLTAVALGGLNAHRAMFLSLSGSLLLVGTVAVGVISVLTSRVRAEALVGLGPTLSTAERQAQIRFRLADRASQVGVVGVIAVISYVAGVAILLLT
jgi:hypothetical protein